MSALPAQTTVVSMQTVLTPLEVSNVLVHQNLQEMATLAVGSCTCVA